jgi:hypothetical protein
MGPKWAAIVVPSEGLAISLLPDPCFACFRRWLKDAADRWKARIPTIGSPSSVMVHYGSRVVAASS